MTLVPAPLARSLTRSLTRSHRFLANIVPAQNLQTWTKRQRNMTAGMNGQRS